MVIHVGRGSRLEAFASGAHAAAGAVVAAVSANKKPYNLTMMRCSFLAFGGALVNVNPGSGRPFAIALGVVWVRVGPRFDATHHFMATDTVFAADGPDTRVLALSGSVARNSVALGVSLNAFGCPLAATFTRFRLLATSGASVSCLSQTQVACVGIAASGEDSYARLFITASDTVIAATDGANVSARGTGVFRYPGSSRPLPVSVVAAVGVATLASNRLTQHRVTFNRTRIGADGCGTLVNAHGAGSVVVAVGAKHSSIGGPTQVNADDVTVAAVNGAAVRVSGTYAIVAVGAGKVGKLVDVANVHVVACDADVHATRLQKQNPQADSVGSLGALCQGGGGTNVTTKALNTTVTAINGTCLGSPVGRSSVASTLVNVVARCDVRLGYPDGLADGHSAAPAVTKVSGVVNGTDVVSADDAARQYFPNSVAAVLLDARTATCEAWCGELWQKNPCFLARRGPPAHLALSPRRRRPPHRRRRWRPRPRHPPPRRRCHQRPRRRLPR